MAGRPDPAFTVRPVKFDGLQTQRELIGERIEQAIRRVLEHGRFIMGPEVAELEAELMTWSGARHAVTCANGTDALLMVLMAQSVRPGDAIVCPAFTFPATPEAIALLGATPVFVEVDPRTFNLDPGGLPHAAEAAARAGLTLKGVIAADLFGQPADYESIGAFAGERGLWVIDDAAQSFGATYKGRPIGGHTLATTTSFFPAKPLGCYGDGGAILTDDDGLAETLRSIRVHGKGVDKYDNVRVGLNSRLDTIQAAVLLEKLRILQDEIRRRDAAARAYSRGLSPWLATPEIAPDTTSVWAQYTIQVPAGLRDGLKVSLAARGVPTAIYYPCALPDQPAYAAACVTAGELAVARALPKTVLSLPMHPYLSDPDQAHVIQSIVDYLDDGRAALARSSKALESAGRDVG